MFMTYFYSAGITGSFDSFISMLTSLPAQYAM